MKSYRVIVTEATFWELHRYEITFAAIFAVIVLVVWEVVQQPFRKIYKRFLSKPFQRLNRRIKGIEVLRGTAVDSSINSHFGDQVSYIVNAIEKHDALVKGKRFHYKDEKGRYHLERKFNLWPLLNGAENFFPILCDSMSRRLSFAEIDLIALVDKGTNNLFQREFAKNAPRRIKILDLSCSKNSENSFEYHGDESLEGRNVIFLESLVVFPDLFLDSVKWVQRQGANIKKFVILFDGSGSLLDFNSCGIKVEDVIIGSFIDLKLTKAEECKCGKELRNLRYFEY